MSSEPLKTRVVLFATILRSDMLCNIVILCNVLCYGIKTWHIWQGPILHLLARNFNDLFRAPLATLRTSNIQVSYLLELLHVRIKLNYSVTTLILGFIAFYYIAELFIVVLETD